MWAGLGVLALSVTACGRFDFRVRADAEASPDGAVDATVVDAAGDPDAAVPCAYACAIDAVARTTTCAGAIAVTQVADQAIAVVTMTGRSELAFTALLCDPTGFPLHFGDSPTNNGGGGDAATFSNDAEAHFTGPDFFVHGNDYQVGLLLARTPFVVATGCTPLTGRVLDQEFHITGSQSGDVVSPFALRLNPPMDAEGPPDAIWYLGVNRTYGDAARIGTGLRSIQLCLR